MAENQQSPPSLEEFRAAKAALEKKATPPSLEQFRAAKAAQSGKKVPEIPPVEEPTEAKPPFVPPSSVLEPAAPLARGEGGLGAYSPLVAKTEQTARDFISAADQPPSDGQLPSESPSPATPSGKMPFRGDLAKEPRKPELISTDAVEKGREGKEQKNWWEPMPDSERKVLEDRLRGYNTIRDFSPGVVAEKNKITERLKKDDELRNHPEKYNPNHPDYAFLANKELRQELWPEFDVRRFAGKTPKSSMISANDILAGYKQPSIDSNVLEDPSIWQQLGLVPLSSQGRRAIEESLFEQSRSAGGFMASPTGLGSIEMSSAQAPKRILSDEEKQKAKNALELDEAIRKGLPTLALESSPIASLVHHNRVIAKKANEFYNGDVSKYMDITESRNIITNYLSESDQQENKILSDLRSMESVWKTQVKAGNNDVATETLKAITKKKDEYTKLVAQKQLDITNEIRALSQSDDPEAKRKIEVLRAQNQLFMMTDEEREKFALNKAVPNVDQLRDTVFKGMSDRDILRLALHTKYLQLQEILPDNVVAKGFDAMRVTDMLDEDVRRLKQEIAILAPVVFLNKTPIKKIDEGFFPTAGKAFGAGFGGEGTERTRASKLSQVLQDYGVMEGVAPEAATGMEAAQAVESWSAEEAGELVGTSGEFMVKLIPTAVLTEMGLGSVGIAAQVKRGADVLKLIGRVADSRKALYAGRALQGTYEAVKQGLSYELGGRLYDQEDEMDFLNGSFGGLGGFIAGGAASKVADGLEKRIFAAFGSASDDVASKMIEFGKRASASGVRSIGQGVGETVEEFGEALGGIIDKSDSAAEIMKNLKEQFPDASSAFHFAAQSFLMGSIMGQSSTIGSALYKRANDYYSQLTRGEKDKIDQLIREVDEVGAGVKEEVERPADERLAEVRARITQIQAANQRGEVLEDYKPRELINLREEERRLVEQLKPEVPAEPMTTVEAEEEISLVPVVARGTPVGERIGRRGEYVDPATGQTVVGDVWVDGQTVVLETADRIYEIGNVEELSSKPDEELSITIVEPTVTSNENGEFVYSGKDEIIPKGVITPQGTGLKAIKRNKKGEITRVVVTDSEGNTRNLRGQEALDMEYQMLLRHAEEHEPKLEQDEEAVTEIESEHSRQTQAPTTREAGKDIEEGVQGRDVSGGLTQPKPTTDAVQERTTAEVGAQPVGTEGAGQEGRGGVGPSVQGPEAPQAGGPQGQVIPPPIAFTEGPSVGIGGGQGFAPRLRELGYTDAEISKMNPVQQQNIVEKGTEPARAESTARVTPTAEGPVRPEAPPAPAAAPAPTAAPTPSKGASDKVKKLAKAERGTDTNNPVTKAKAQKKVDELLDSDARLKEVNNNFAKAVADLEKSGKLKVRCP